MSRIRIVEGTITKNTGGDHFIYSENGDIVFNAGLKIRENAAEYIYTTEPKDPPIPKSIAKCEVQFRPHKNWKGEFGFDWERIGDSKVSVDNSYKNIIGKYGSIYASEPGAKFTSDKKLYEKHLREYSSFTSYKGKYCIPNVTLMENKTAYFDAITEVEEKPDKLHYAYDTKIFELTILEKLTITVGKHYDEKVLSIKCLKKFGTKQSIRLIATKDGKMEKVGEIHILPNNKIKEINILFIPVNYKKTGATGAIKGNEKTITKNALSQAYIDANFKIIRKIDIGGWWFDTFFTTKDEKGNVLIDVSGWSSLHKYLEKDFFEIKENEKYRDYYRVYMLPASKGLNGIAEDVGNTKVVVAFQNRNDSSSVHELMHAMGLYHTFDNDGLYTYQFRKTDNIMDYTHQIGKQRFSTNHWQWKILNSDIL